MHTYTLVAIPRAERGEVRQRSTPRSGVPLPASCEQVNWVRLRHFAIPEPAVHSGKAAGPGKRSLDLHCSLHVDHLQTEDGGTYVCDLSIFSRRFAVQFVPHRCCPGVLKLLTGTVCLG
ncbi:hypothetical protein GN956_G10203 [Arapaima gigas]